LATTEKPGERIEDVWKLVLERARAA